jgi:predicted signal transduction protein with EAL and GGDEF domain
MNNTTVNYSNTDTESSNRQHLHHTFKVERRGETSKKAAVLELNLNLKELQALTDNDAHQIEELLQKVAERLHHRLRDNDVILPLSDDKFMILLEDLKSLSNADAVSQDLIEILKNPFNLSKKQQVEIGTSISISFFSE